VKLVQRNPKVVLLPFQCVHGDLRNRAMTRVAETISEILVVCGVSLAESVDLVGVNELRSTVVAKSLQELVPRGIVGPNVDVDQ
jgi:hypothetical protein